MKTIDGALTGNVASVDSESEGSSWRHSIEAPVTHTSNAIPDILILSRVSKAWQICSWCKLVNDTIAKLPSTTTYHAVNVVKVHLPGGAETLRTSGVFIQTLSDRSEILQYDSGEG